MKQQIIRISQILVLALFSLFLFSGNIAAQDTGGRDIPFIDNDGDGINDLGQSRRGQRIAHRLRNLGIAEQLGVDIITEDGQKLVDTDGDGIGDIGLREFIQSNLETLVDTDGDGVADTQLGDVLGGKRGQFLEQLGAAVVFENGQRLVDIDGDGVGDQSVRNFIQDNLETLVDTDGDGVADTALGEVIGKRGGHRGFRGGEGPEGGYEDIRNGFRGRGRGPGGAPQGGAEG